MTTKERLKKFLKHLNTGQNSFERKVGIANGYINNLKGSIGSDNIDKIGTHFPELNIEWLISGKGEMLKTSTVTDSFSIVNFKQRGYAPFYSEMRVSGGQYDLAKIGDEEPDSWVKFPGITADAWFPVIGFSMEPKIYSGDIVGVVVVNNWERVDTEIIYMVVTIYDRMIKRLQLDESDPEIIWAISENYPKFKLHRSEILKIYRVVWAGRLV